MALRVKLVTCGALAALVALMFAWFSKGQAIFAGLNLLAVALFGIVVRQWWEGGGRRGSILIAILTAVAVTFAAFLWLDPRSIPVQWITTLHEGRSSRNIRQIFGAAAHAGENYRFLIGLFAPGLDLRGTVRMNLWLSGLNIVFFGAIARHVFERWWAALIAILLLVANPIAIHLALSEVPAAAIGLYCSMAFTAGALLERRERVESLAAWPSLGLLAVLTLLLAWTRAETSLLPGVAFGLGCLRTHFGDERLLGASNALGRRMLGLVRTRWFWPLALSLVVLQLPVRNEVVSWLRAALHPLNLSFLTLPAEMFELLFPLGVVVLFVLGMLHALRRWRAFLLLPIPLLIIYRAYFAAACSTHFELLRYLSYLLVPISLVALFGIGEARSLLEKLGLGGPWRRIVAVLFVLSLGTWPREDDIQAAFMVVGRDQISKHFPITRDVQQETRFLLAAVERHPECLFVARVARMDSAERGRPMQYDHLVFGKNQRVPLVVRDAPDARQALTRVAPASCAFFYRSLDCNLLDADGCEDASADAVPSEELVFARNHYNNVEEYGATLPVVRLALYPLRPGPPDSSPLSVTAP